MDQGTLSSVSFPLPTQESLWQESGVGSSWLLEENRVTHQQGLARILEAGGEISPAFAIPFLTLSSLRLDWLHIADQGITPVFLGGLFHYIISLADYGPNEDVRLEWLWNEIQAFYDREQTQDRLFNLTKTMIKPKTGSIELSGSAAQIRCLVPLALQLVNQWEPPLPIEAQHARDSYEAPE